MDEAQYFKERLDHQIEWYDGKSASCQNRYKFIKIMIGLLSLLIAPIGLLLQDCIYAPCIYAYSAAPFQELVERCENIISSENIDWAQLHKNEPTTPNQNHASTGS